MTLPITRRAVIAVETDGVMEEFEADVWIDEEHNAMAIYDISEEDNA